jgi:hypothetical protein
VPGDRLGGHDHREEGIADRGQAFAQRHRGIGLEQAGGHAGLAVRAHGLREQALLVAEVAVDGEFGDAGLAGDLVHADAIEAMRDEHALGGIEDGGTLAGVFRPAGTGGLGGGVCGGFRGT